MGDREAASLFSSHPRSFRENRYVYPVLSRRAGGISLGINLNPGKDCNFHCIYCQVDRREMPPRTFVEVDRLVRELEAGMELVVSGKLFDDAKFAAVPPDLRALHDIAFSGDGEPTTFRNFDEVVERCTEIKQQLAPPDVKTVVITNASMLDRPAVVRAMACLDRSNGEIWAKLDAGTEAYYRRVARASIPFDRILANITMTAKARPIVIQTLFMKIDDVPPSEQEIAAYIERLREITAAGGRIRLVQIYTVARAPAESYVAPLEADQLDAIVDRVRSVTDLPVVGYV
ncbi:MAG: radical SAM protein [Planctomycetota bacterium]|nr:MAG: radical SAM protein [Planctomycetota bacterium]